MLAGILIGCLYTPSFSAEDSPVQIIKEEETKIPGHKEMDCTACHRTTPASFDPKDATPINEDYINLVCRKCHDFIAVVTSNHHLEPTPFAEEELIPAMQEMKLLSAGQGITCITCHDPHGKPEDNHFLKDAYVQFADKSKLINPHWKENRCTACHMSKPADSSFLNFKFKGDYNKMCNICHDTISAQKLLHSVGMVPSPTIKEKMPKTFVLSSKGEVVCITCHELKYQCLKQEFKRKGLNPLFFRGGPYSTRTALCYRCHDESEYERLNPHDQISDEGELMSDRCLYCHALIPNPKTDDDISKVRFHVDKDLKQLCQRCHRDRPHPGGTLARPTFDHIVVPPEKNNMWRIKSEKEKGVIFPLEPGRGNIFCCTCHNPHERGVMFRPNADKGSDQKNRLRLGGAYELCDSCHGWNK